jgi:hypothetical protein
MRCSKNTVLNGTPKRPGHRGCLARNSCASVNAYRAFLRSGVTFL